MPKTPAAASATPDIAASENARALRQLGQLVRARRRHLGLKLAELAERSGLSTPFLSQVENGVGTPSLTSLFAIARVLGTTAEALLAGPPAAAVVVVGADDGTFYPLLDGSEATRRRQLTAPGERISAAEYIIEPGADLGGFESSAGREMLHVLEGRLVVDVRRGDLVDSYDLAAGATILYDTTDAHRWRALDGGRTRFLHVVAPE